MAISIKGVGKRLTSNEGDVFYTAPGDVTSATVASGTIENIINMGAKVNIRVGGRNLWVLRDKSIPVLASPLVVPPITLMPGEALQIWSDTPSALDVNLTIGEQR